jgi:hypothetical protein
VGVGGRGKYRSPAAAHKEKEQNKPQRYLIGQVVKGERL